MTDQNEPESPPTLSLHDRVAEVIEWIRPALQNDGGDIELVGVDPLGVVSVRIHGACVGCPARGMTLTFGVERTLRERIPEVTQVLCVS